MRWWLVFLLVTVFASPVAAAAPDSLISFQIEDQFKQVHNEGELADKVVVLVFVDRKTQKLKSAWVNALTEAMTDKAVDRPWEVRVVAHTQGAPFFVKGRIRKSFSQDPARWALLDWRGLFRAAYQLPKNQVTVLVFNSRGQLLRRYSGEDVDPVAVDDLVGTAATGVPLVGLGARIPAPEDFPALLVAAAMERLSHHVIYDGSYRRLDYPGGDVPDGIGVCSDVVVRAYRGVGIDLQRAVHEDMMADFAAYPKNWGLTGPDKNIDHRRVPNLQVFFTRHGESLPVTQEAKDYRPGDVVTWMLPGNLPHIGLVVERRSPKGERPLVVHNIGGGPVLDDALFRFPQTGHYRYDGSR